MIKSAFVSRKSRELAMKKDRHELRDKGCELWALLEIDVFETQKKTETVRMRSVHAKPRSTHVPALLPQFS